MIKDVFSSLDDKHIKGSITKAAGDKLAEVGYDEKYGARPLRKAIRSNIEDPLSDMFLSGALKDVATLKIDYRRGKFVFDTVKKADSIPLSEIKEKKDSSAKAAQSL